MKTITFSKLTVSTLREIANKAQFTQTNTPEIVSTYKTRMTWKTGTQLNLKPSADIDYQKQCREDNAMRIYKEQYLPKQYGARPIVKDNTYNGKEIFLNTKNKIVIKA
jgi:hypothetical protein